MRYLQLNRPDESLAGRHGETAGHCGVALCSVPLPTAREPYLHALTPSFLIEEARNQEVPVLR